MDTTERFSGRSQQYVKYRPSYSQEVIQHLIQEIGIISSNFVADIGAGTGIFTEKLLEQHIQTVAVEPNDDMRSALIQHLQSYLTDSTQDKLLLTVSNGSAEQTDLANESVDHIVCAQAYHWFNAELAQTEFKRILKQGGQVVLLWNQRDVGASAFMNDYDALFLKYGKEYDEVKHKHISQTSLKSFYGGYEPQLASYQYSQQLDRAGLFGRIQSSSFSLQETDSRYDEYSADIEHLFANHEQNGMVNMLYRTDIYWGQML
ncbi:class I SAM-dependent methyltransferase [Paenibacillus endoradicis]|uniref:class I SAM-dependent methyltransferase n=1 Tax=Paenibacillus endoradicis TaxID=2972487 RepID=UPI0021597957|nr:class I SAM-dependent methyltransferase [Paenibacillus endoradicis]MCR8655754.1 class I SAM-dependent methyltransferase [Paenibacillus endoradicis]MCR8658080.1 class I SAM-dependent methyltransferase [Paenibacillus endoradicis]